MNETTIKLKTGTKDLLEEMKVIDRETFDQVIVRLIENLAEDEMELSEYAKDLLEKRLESMKKGNFLSVNQVIEKMREARKKESQND
jgi:hypothetical protein